MYFETPLYFGVIEQHGAQIAELAHAVGAEVIVGVDAISLGAAVRPPSTMAPTSSWGTTQPLGVRMNGGAAPPASSPRDEERYAHQYPTLFISISETTKEVSTDSA